MLNREHYLPQFRYYRRRENEIFSSKHEMWKFMVIPNASGVNFALIQSVVYFLFFTIFFIYLLPLYSLNRSLQIGMEFYII